MIEEMYFLFEKQDLTGLLMVVGIQKIYIVKFSVYILITQNNSFKNLETSLGKYLHFNFIWN